MTKNKKPLVETKFLVEAHASLQFGSSLWETEALIATGICANTPETALDGHADFGKLAGPAMYYAKSRREDEGFPMQIVLKPKTEDRVFSFAGISRDADGDLILSDDNAYEIKQVVAKREFRIPNSTSVIEPGYRTLKAAAL